MTSTASSTAPLAQQVTGAPRVIDLRSDTLTKPSPGMRNAMATAEVGDDVYGEDPTVNELERRCAELTGKEATLFVPTGTMANLLAIMVHCQGRGEEMIAGHKSHILLNEQGGMSQFGGVMCRTIQNLPDCTFDMDELRGLLRPRNDYHQPWSRLICVENPHNFGGGQIMPLDHLKEVYDFAIENSLVVHMDGARVLNAAVELGVPVSEVLQYCHSLNMCFSKGLSAPVGSILAGTKDFIAKARRLRKAVGGGMRQAGVLAAACIYSLDHIMPLIKQDNQHAKKIAKALQVVNSGVVEVEFEGLRTNIILVKVVKPGLTAAEFCQRMAQVTDEEVASIGEAVIVKMGSIAKQLARLLTHYDVNSEDVDVAIRKLQYVVEEFGRK